MKTAIILVSGSSIALAESLKRELPQAELVSTTDAQGCRRIDSLNGFLSEAFSQYDAFIFIGALGICVRSIAPFVEDKRTDPAVVCVDGMGRHAISVLSGHIGKANELTARVAGILGAEPVITTQSDLSGLWALDTLGERFHWHSHVFLPEVHGDAISSLRESTSEMQKREMNNIIGLFVSGVPTALYLGVRDKGTDWLEAHLPTHVTLCTRTEEIDPARFRLLIAVSPVLPNTSLPTLTYMPQVVQVGIGLAHQAGPTEEVKEALFEVLRTHGVPSQAIASFNTIDVKQNEPVVHSLQEGGYPVHIFTSEELNAVEVPNPSMVVAKHVGTSSVSEASALLAAGGNELLIPKQKGSNYTLAASINRHNLRKGHIEIVGAGPGDPDLISVRGRQLLEKADLILYAGSLVPHELTLCAKPGATVCSSASMNLEEQFLLMKGFYDKGAFIVRLHTGDPCIYGAIQEQMNYFDKHNMSYHITPGISSFQAAAAALQSQFTIPEKVQSIILTRGEGRTPMPEKEQLHLLARSQSTMCIFLSAGIAEQVQEELLQEYPPHTPVAVCYHLTWKDERIYRGELKDLARIVKENKLTLTTMIVVGEAIDNRKGLSRLYAPEFKHLFRE